MILAFEFNYISKNGILENLLKEIVVDYNINHKILRKDSIVTLYVEDEEARLLAFAEHLSTMLPLSIFFKSSSVQVIDVWPTDEETLPTSAYSVEFTPKLLALVDSQDSEHYLSPFPLKEGSKEIHLIKDTETLICAKSAEDYKKTFEMIVQTLQSGKCVSIQTKNGYFTYGAIENLPAQCRDFEVIATDLSVVERMVVCRENELKALATIERPAIRFKVNALYAQKEILSTARVMLRLADDLFLYQLCKHLFAHGIHFLFKTSSQAIVTESRISYDVQGSALEPLVISVLENGVILVVNGSSYATPSLKESLRKFDEPSHGAYASILQEHQLFDAISTCFYLSRFHDDRFMHYSKEHGMLNLVGFNLPRSFAELFGEIERSSPSAERLVANYKEQFPEIYAKALMTPIPETLPKSIYSLFRIASIVLGLSDDFETSAEQLIENAENYGGQKGPRIDYYLEKEDALHSDFDYVRMIRSSISYKLAGTDNVTLSFGYMESLSFFLSDMADTHRENLSASHMALAGSLFGYKRLTEMLFKNLKPNHTICFNRELPIDQ